MQENKWFWDRGENSALENKVCYICSCECDVKTWRWNFFLLLFELSAVGKKAPNNNLKNKPSVPMPEYCFYCRNSWFVHILKLLPSWLQKRMVFQYSCSSEQEQAHYLRTKWRRNSSAKSKWMLNAKISMKLVQIN